MPTADAVIAWQHIERRALDLHAAGTEGTAGQLQVQAMLDFLAGRRALRQLAGVRSHLGRLLTVRRWWRKIFEGRPRWRSNRYRTGVDQRIPYLAERTVTAADQEPDISPCLSSSCYENPFSPQPRIDLDGSVPRPEIVFLVEDNSGRRESF